MVAVRLFVTCAVAAGCGRIGFEATSGDDVAGDAGADAMLDAPPDVAIPTCVADGLCAALCVTMDPDCATTCGDGFCRGNGGELCNTCAADCATRQPVCGNGACDPGEAASACYADCGPAPWTWASEEATLLILMNNRRTVGFQCPGQPSVVTAPPLTFDPAILADAREWVWEIAHQDFRRMNGDMCNGRTWPERRNPARYDAFLHAFGAGATPAAAINAWSTDPGSCETVLMNPALTVAAIGGAHDVAEAYVVLLR